LHGTEAVLAVNETSVPWATVLVRKSFGVAAAAHFGNNPYVIAWPSSESGALPLEGGVAVAFSKEIEKFKGSRKKEKGN
jgi:acetyl-CoA carboxylase carboxyltransferase component